MVLALRRGRCGGPFIRRLRPFIRRLRQGPGSNQDGDGRRNQQGLLHDNSLLHVWACARENPTLVRLRRSKSMRAAGQMSDRPGNYRWEAFSVSHLRKIDAREQMPMAELL